MDPTLLAILIIVIVLVISLIVIIVIRRVIKRRRQLIENAAHQQFVPPPLFVPKGRVTYNLPANQQQIQIQKPQGSSSTQGFQGRGRDKTLKGTCFLTGNPRSSCNCDQCIENRRSI